MSHDLEEFEQSLKNKYGNYRFFEPSIKVQKIVNFINFTLEDIEEAHTLISRPMYGGLKSDFRSNSFSFDANVSFFGQLAIERLFYMYCKASREIMADVYVIVFPANVESQIYNVLKRVERLKAFL